MNPIDADAPRTLIQVFLRQMSLDNQFKRKRLKNVPCDQLSMRTESETYDMAIQNGSTFVQNSRQRIL